jgi:hypothetical protein
MRFLFTVSSICVKSEHSFLMDSHNAKAYNCDICSAIIIIIGKLIFDTSTWASMIITILPFQL